MVGIAGPVGSGKSALIKSMLGELKISSGRLTVEGTLAYAPQQPWIIGETIKDNIVFHSDFDWSKQVT